MEVRGRPSTLTRSWSWAAATARIYCLWHTIADTPCLSAWTGRTSQIDVADAHRLALGLPNVKFLHADFLTAARRLPGEFDYILAHGVLSWVPQEVHDALLELFARRLRPGGLLYVNYNTRPGWNVRGLVREFLLAQTTAETGLRARPNWLRKSRPGLFRP